MKQLESFGAQRVALRTFGMQQTLQDYQIGRKNSVSRQSQIAMVNSRPNSQNDLVEWHQIIGV